MKKCVVVFGLIVFNQLVDATEFQTIAKNASSLVECHRDINKEADDRMRTCAKDPRSCVRMIKVEAEPARKSCVEKFRQ